MSAMTAASVFLIYRNENTDTDIVELKKALKDYKGYWEALDQCEIEVLPYRNMKSFAEIYDWIVPQLRTMKHFATRALLWVFPEEMQAAFDAFVREEAEKLGVRTNYEGFANGYADIPKGCGFAIGRRKDKELPSGAIEKGEATLTRVANTIKHELTHIVWALTWHDAKNNLLDKAALYEGREQWPWVDKRRSVTIEGRHYTW